MRPVQIGCRICGEVVWASSEPPRTEADEPPVISYEVICDDCSAEDA